MCDRSIRVTAILEYSSNAHIACIKTQIFLLVSLQVFDAQRRYKSCPAPLYSSTSTLKNVVASINILKESVESDC